MKRIHINYANLKYFKSQEYCTQTALQAGFDETYSYRYNDMDKDFIRDNFKVLSESRGSGYWLWKSYFIKKTLDKLNHGDLLVYSDSGSYYINSIQPLVDKILLEESGVLSFELLGLFEYQYTKKDAFTLMECNEEKYINTSQREATYIWLIKNDFTVHLIDEYLKYSQNENILSDIPNVSGDNYPGFIDHRHDQSIWSLLMKKYGIPGHRLISQHGDHLVNDFPEDKYPQITLHHRSTQ